MSGDGERARAHSEGGDLTDRFAAAGNDRYLRTAGDWNRRIVFSNTAAKPRI
jgi:hypothetical protein